MDFILDLLISIIKKYKIYNYILTIMDKFSKYIIFISGKDIFSIVK